MSISDQKSMESANRTTDAPESEASMPRVSTTVPAPSGFISKHKLRASISCLQSQIDLILKELEELETTETCNSVCSELLSIVDSTPDPLLPLTRGPVDVSCDRWFGPVRSPRMIRRWI
ncbi:hypothetical protein Droror1_Dr00017062 [Drosera rotundifolia]